MFAQGIETMQENETMGSGFKELQQNDEDGDRTVEEQSLDLLQPSDKEDQIKTGFEEKISGPTTVGPITQDQQSEGVSPEDHLESSQ